jgi:hypothetical protein
MKSILYEKLYLKLNNFIYKKTQTIQNIIRFWKLVLYKLNVTIINKDLKLLIVKFFLWIIK